MLSCSGHCDGPIPREEEFYRGLCACVISKFRQRDRLAPSRAVAPQEKIKTDEQLIEKNV